MFIATQAPLEGTIGDFWRMTWEQNSQTVVMLSKEYEGVQVMKWIFSAFLTWTHLDLNNNDLDLD